MFNDDMYSAVDLMIKLDVDPKEVNHILHEIENSEPAKRASVIGALSTLADRSPIVNATAKMEAYEKLCSELSSLNTMRGGAKGFKGFVGESMEAARQTAAGRSTVVVNDNGPVDLVFVGKNGHKYNQQLKIGYRPGQIDFAKYQGQTVVVDKGNPYFKTLQAEGSKHGVKVIEGTVTEAEAKFWGDAMQLETKVTGNTHSYIVPKVQQTVNNLSAIHNAGVSAAKTGALYGAGFSAGRNIVDVARGKISAGEAAANVVCDTAISGGVSYVGGAAASAIGRTAAGRAVGAAIGSVGATVSSVPVVGTAVGAVSTATAAIGSAAAGAVATGVGAVGAVGSAVGSAAVAATAGTAVGGAVAAGVGAATAAGAAIGAAAVAAAPVLAVGAVIGGIFSIFFDD